MKTTTLIVEALEMTQHMLQSTLADFSDADMLTRPAPSANHAAWQMGHLIKSESGMINGISEGASPALPSGFAEKYTKETASSDDPSAFDDKAKLMELFAKARAATIAFTRGATDAQLDAPAPERMRRMVATNAQVLLLQANHATMHVGQFQVLRRKLGKPILF